MEWLNFYGLIFLILIMLPNIVFAATHKDGFENSYRNKYAEIFEQIGRAGCFAFIFIQIPPLVKGFYFHGAQEGRKADLIRTAPRVGFELDCAHALTAGQTGCSYSYRYRSVIGTGVICEEQEPQEKKRALSAIMAHYEKSRPFAFTDEQTQRVAVFRLDVAQLTCKEHL